MPYIIVESILVVCLPLKFTDNLFNRNSLFRVWFYHRCLIRPDSFGINNTFFIENIQIRTHLSH